MTSVERARNLIVKRLSDLEGEAASLKRALASLEEVDGRGKKRAQTATRSGGKTRAARGQRQAEFLAAIKKRPGAPMAEIARKMGVKPQQLYPIARRLTDAGELAKRDGRYVLAGSNRK